MKTNREENREAAIAVIKAAGANFGSAFISRDKVESFTGGAVKARHLANCDSAGRGIQGAFKVGRRQCYPVDSLVDWLISRLEV